MANWRATYGPDSKGAIDAALAEGCRLRGKTGSLTGDAPPPRHLVSALSAAREVVAALVGKAPRVRVNIAGYYDPSEANISGHVASSIKIEVTEVW